MDGRRPRHHCSRDGMGHDVIMAILFVVGGLILAALLWMGTTRIGRTRRTGDEATLIPAGVSLTAQPLLTNAEASFYNVLRLAVQDEYLVFAQIPLWCLVDVTASTRQARHAFLSQIALKRVDFVLVHPG